MKLHASIWPVKQSLDEKNDFFTLYVQIFFYKSEKFTYLIFFKLFLNKRPKTRYFFFAILVFYKVPNTHLFGI